jgi:hypothetical protein
VWLQEQEVEDRGQTEVGVLTRWKFNMTLRGQRKLGYKQYYIVIVFTYVLGGFLYLFHLYGTFGFLYYYLHGTCGFL